MRKALLDSCIECRDGRHRLCSSSQELLKDSHPVEAWSVSETRVCCDGALVWTETRRVQLA